MEKRSLGGRPGRTPGEGAGTRKDRGFVSGRQWEERRNKGEYRGVGARFRGLPQQHATHLVTQSKGNLSCDFGGQNFKIVRRPMFYLKILRENPPLDSWLA